MNPDSPTLLYCHCQYAQAVPQPVKAAVLHGLCDSGLPFEAVPDLCELSARADPSLQRFASGPIKIAACYPRAIKGLFAAARVPLPERDCEVLNMRTLTADQVLASLRSSSISPNLPRRATPSEAAAVNPDSIHPPP